MVEEDFLSAELMAVPAAKAVDIGLDRSVIGAYGQDDRVCSYACLQAPCWTGGSAPADWRMCAGGQGGDRLPGGHRVCSPSGFDIFMSDLCDSQGAALKRLLECLLPLRRRDSGL